MTQDTFEMNSALFNESWQAWMDTQVSAMKSFKVLADTADEEVEIATLPKDEVFRADKVRVFEYQALARTKTSLPPILICYGLFGRQTMIDLQEDRSLVRNLLEAGHRVFVVDWGTPSRVDKNLSLDDYILGYLQSALGHVNQLNDGRPSLVFGICEGGTFASCLAALKPELFAGLALAITPIDFRGQPEKFWLGEGQLNLWVSQWTEEDIDLLLETYGNMPGQMYGAMFSALTPMATMTKYNLGLAKLAGNEAATMNFLRMEKWIAGRPDHPGAAAKQWLYNLYVENQLVKGAFEIGGQIVDLRDITCPVLNIYAVKDHIVPVTCSKPLEAFIAEDKYTDLCFPGGHVGVFVSSKAQGVVAGGLSDWMTANLKQKAVKSK